MKDPAEGNDFLSKYGKLHIEGLPKYAQLREALRSAVEAGHWRPGEKLPPEAVLASTTPFSLGTVQKALRALVKEGLVERRQGRGTFVSGDRRQMNDPWHFRFSKGDEERYLPVYPKIIARKTISSRDSFARLINPDTGRLIQIDRIIVIEDQFSMLSKFFMAAERFRGFLDKSIQELESVNFKTILRREYNLSIQYMNHTVQMMKFSREVARHIGVPVGTTGIVLRIIAISAAKKPVYYQELFIPPNDLKLHISDSMLLPEYWT